MHAPTCASADAEEARHDPVRATIGTRRTRDDAMSTASRVASVMSLDEALAHLIAADPRFAVTETEIRGEPQRVFANAPAHLPALLDAAAAAHPEAEALVFGAARWTYADLARDVARLANAMTDRLGVRPGDRVALAMRNLPELPILILAVNAMGGVAVPMNAWWTADELAYALADCGASVVFADDERFARLAPVAAETGVRLVAVGEAAGPLTCAALREGAREDPPQAAIHPDDDFAVMYSSGSTGHPKGVILTHRGAISAVWSWFLGVVAARLTAEAAGTAPADPRPQVWLVITPLFHVTALHAVLLQGLAVGAKMVLMRKWDPDAAVDLIKAEGVTRFNGVPTQSADLLEAARRRGETLSTLEFIGAGGAKRPAAQVGRLAEVFPAAMLVTGWGMTETNALGITLSGPDYLAHPEAAGRLTPPLQDMRITAEDGRPVAEGEIGELELRGPNVMRGYLNQPEATAETLRGGWLRTGDLARIGPGGFVHIVDRRKSIIIRGGENISCLDVEGALHAHPAVAEACAFPVPDERLGEIVGAAVLLHPGATADAAALTAFLTPRIARFKIPERVWFLDAPLDRGATEKVDRRAVRARCLGAAGAAPAKG